MIHEEQRAVSRAFTGQRLRKGTRGMDSEEEDELVIVTREDSKVTSGGVPKGEADLEIERRRQERQKQIWDEEKRRRDKNNTQTIERARMAEDSGPLQVQSSQDADDQSRKEARAALRRKHKEITKAYWNGLKKRRQRNVFGKPGMSLSPPGPCRGFHFACSMC